jgi:exoribonuclease R
VAVIVSYTVRADGGVDAGDVGQARVRNRAKLTYNSVDAWLVGDGTIPEAATGVMDQIGIQYEAAQRLKQRRHEEGALDLEAIEPRVTAVNGRVVDLRREKKNRARSLIEDIMIAANGVTARYLEANGLPSVRRVVRSPARWGRLQALAAELGDTLERQIRKSAGALLLSNRIGQRFEAIITGAAAKGTWVRISDLPAEGRLVRGAAGLDIGDRLRVRRADTDVDRGFIDFEGTGSENYSAESPLISLPPPMLAELTPLMLQALAIVVLRWQFVTISVRRVIAIIAAVGTPVPVVVWRSRSISIWVAI